MAATDPLLSFHSCVANAGRTMHGPAARAPPGGDACAFGGTLRAPARRRFVRLEMKDKDHAAPLPAERLVVGMSGASGVIYGIRLLELLRPMPVETHFVMSRAAEMTTSYETGYKPAAVKHLADHCHPIGDVGASISSGSFKTLGMVVAPCSVRTMSEIASGVTTTLLTRAADVTLKERRRLVLLVRETPLHSGHLRTMLALSEMGAVVMPPVPAFYAKPASVEQMVDQTLGRTLDLLGLDAGITLRWGEHLGGEPARRR